MRRLAALMVVFLLPFCMGCSGGNGGTGPKPLTITPNQLTIDYLNWVVNAPQSETQRLYEFSLELWAPQNASIFTNLRLTVPFLPEPLAVNGPLLVSTSVGAYQESVPTDVYWGSGDAIPHGQPLRIRSGDWLPGYQTPPNDLYVYHKAIEPETTPSVAGMYRLTDSGGLSQSWDVPATQSLLPPANILEPSVIVVNAKDHFLISWESVPGVMGYFVFVQGDIMDQAKNPVRHITWSHAQQPLIFDAINDYTPYLLPASVNQVTVPANIFRGCQTILVTVLSHGIPFDDTLSLPSLHINSVSLSTQLYVTYEK